MNNKKLIITADDYGYLDYIDDAIIDAVADGMVNSVACFANVEELELERKIAKLKNANPNVAIGLHITFCSGSPISLNNDSVLTTKEKDNLVFKFIQDHILLEIKQEDIISETVAQFNRLSKILNKLGMGKIDSLSSHFNFLNYDPKLFNCLLEVAINTNTPIRASRRFEKYYFSRFRISLLWGALINVGDGVASAVRNLTENGMNSQTISMFEKGVKSTSYFSILFYARSKREKIVHFFLGLFGEDQSIYNFDSMELIFHLGKPNPNQQSIYRGIDAWYKREKEYELIMYNDRFRNKIKSLESGLSTFNDL